MYIWVETPGPPVLFSVPDALTLESPWMYAEALGPLDYDNAAFSNGFDVSPGSTPEPSTVELMMIGLFLVMRKRIAKACAKPL